MPKSKMLGSLMKSTNVTKFQSSNNHHENIPKNSNFWSTIHNKGRERDNQLKPYKSTKFSTKGRSKKLTKEFYDLVRFSYLILLVCTKLSITFFYLNILLYYTLSYYVLLSFRKSMWLDMLHIEVFKKDPVIRYSPDLVIEPDLT